MVNHYETAFILTPVLSEAQMKEAVDKFKGLLTEVICPLFCFGGADTPPQLYIFGGRSTVTDLDRLFISRKTTEMRFI